MTVADSSSSSQWLVRFQDITYVIDAPADDLRIKLSRLTNYPSDWIQVTQIGHPFCSARLCSRILGGKGGFGTLLKGQSRQAGAKTTTNFGACRDLQGRRLQHVNDSIAFTKWNEWNEKVAQGLATEEEMAKALTESDSGLAGWYLALPGWAAVGKRERQAIKRQFHVWKREQAAKRAQKEAAKDLQERQIQSYLQKTEETTAIVQERVQSALQEGLRKRQRHMDPPPAIWTLSGDANLVYDGAWVVTSDSNFCTIAILLQPRTKITLYFEVGLRSNGIVQVGWATPKFRPNSSSGDGVGDCKYSWAYDPNRTSLLHHESIKDYGPKHKWKAGDTVGCLYDPEMGKIVFSYNGTVLGDAFTVYEDTLFPAVSCNPGEVVELRLSSEEMKYRPEGATAIDNVLATEQAAVLDEEVSDDEADLAYENETTQAAAPEQPAPASMEAAPIVKEPIDLSQYQSAEELEELGMDRLKGALMAIGVKCGGTLQERAKRLFSLKGVAPDDYPTKLLAKKTS